MNYKADITQLYETSVQRITKWMRKYDIAIISAYRDKLQHIVRHHEERTYMKILDNDGSKRAIRKGDRLSILEQRRRSKILSLFLLQKRYGIARINDGETESYLAVNLSRDPDFLRTLFVLSEWFNQDSLLYKLNNDPTAYVIGTNDRGLPGYRKRKVSRWAEELPSKIMTSIKNTSIGGLLHNESQPQKCAVTFEPPRPTVPSDYKKTPEDIANDWYDIVVEKGISLREIPDGFFGRWGFSLCCGDTINGDAPNDLWHA